MKLNKIISIANRTSELRFLAMVRSLRETGCSLPVWVIPYDVNKFELPEGCIWWEIPEVLNWIDKNRLWPAFKKIQCLTTENYQFVDSDVIFLTNPSIILEPLSGFITSCTHWSNPGETINSETLIFFKRKSSTWPKLVFNSGQWACDRKLYETDELLAFCENNYTDTLYVKNYLYKDQPGINLLVNYINVPITNVTLPPVNMESTWAGDYENDYPMYWMNANRKPYLIHWAGCAMNKGRSIDELFLKYLTEDEKRLWDMRQKEVLKKENKLYNKLYHNLRYLKDVVKSIKFIR